MNSVWAVDVVEAFPCSQLLFEIHVVSVREQLVELVFVGAMGSLDLPVQLRRARLDVDMLHPQISDVPVEQGLELVTSIRADHADSEREPLDDVVDEIDGVRLRLTFVGLQRANSDGIIDAVYWWRCIGDPFLRLRVRNFTSTCT